MSEINYKTKEEVVDAAKKILHRSLRQVIPPEEVVAIEARLQKYGTNRKGYLGDLVEQYIFGLKNNARAEADFNVAGVELKTTPLKGHSKKTYVAKERLVFSMIDYKTIGVESWETSTFLKKNSLLLILFYLYLEQKSLLDYEFKYTYLLDLMKDISAEDVAQIRKDWEYIVEKVKRNEAHLLSEADTYYLGACTKARRGSVVRDQANLQASAKPRAFSLKQSYLNYLIQTKLLNRTVDAISINRGIKKHKLTIEDIVAAKFADFIGKTDKQIKDKLGWHPLKRSKDFKRLMVNRILTGTESKHIEELEKANVTLRVITLEHTGTLKESISFPAFDYKQLQTQVWYDEENEAMADFHADLESQRFLFVVFQKQKGSKDIVLKGFKFWNFPMSDLGEAERVFIKTQECINEGRYQDLPKMSESRVAHVRPHAMNAKDTLETPQGTREIKRCFWLNAKYIQQAIETGLDQS